MCIHSLGDWMPGVRSVDQSKGETNDMGTTTNIGTVGTISQTEGRTLADPVFQAYQILHIGFTVAPILFGLDKFFNLLVDWERYVAPWVVPIVGDPHSFMLAVGVIEILAGLTVAFRPRWGGYIVAAWLLGIIFNLLTYSGFYDIALRDFGLLLAAVALARLSERYDAA